MKKNKFIRIVLLSIVLVSSLFLRPVQVQGEKSTQTKNLSISLVIDNSGSMKEYDPEKLRKNASEILIDLLSPEDNLGVVTFSNDAKDAFALQSVDHNKSMLKEKLEDAFEADGATNYLSALQMAAGQLETAPEESQKIIIFLTDGFPAQKLVDGKLPMPEEEYLQLVKDEFNKIKNMDIAIYPVGFGDSNEELLVEMAEVTNGKAAMLASASEIASSFFDTLTLIKNRNAIEELNTLNFQDELLVPITNYTRQITILMTTAGKDFVIKQKSEPIDGVAIHTGEKYSIVTINQEKPGKQKELPFSIESDGEVTVFAARDLFYTMEILEPLPSTVRALFDNVLLEVGVSEPLEEDMKLEAQIIKNGVPEMEKVSLVAENGVYTALYEEIDTLGDYEVQFEITNADGMISREQIAFSVKNIPVLKSDIRLNEKIISIDEKILMTSFLELQELRVVDNNKLKISEYTFVLIDEQGEETAYQMTDDPSKDTGDLVKGDGIYTSLVELTEFGKFTGIIQVKGTFDGEEFSQEKKLGEFKVSDTGTLSIKFPITPMTIDQSRKITIPIQFTSTSRLEEKLMISLPEDVGRVVTTEITIGPGESIEKEIEVELNSAKSESIDLHFLPVESNLEILEGQSQTLEIARESIITRTLDFFQKNKVIILITLGIVFIVYLIGEYLYRKNIQKSLGSLLEMNYYALTDGPEFKKGIRFTNNHFIINIGELDSKGDLTLPDLSPTNKNFVVKINKVLTRPEGLRIIQGYRSLFHKNGIRIEVEAVFPGLIVNEGKILNHLIIDQDTLFESGGYRFECNLKSDSVKQRKNLLEGKEA